MLDNQGKLYAASHHTKQCPNQTTVPPTCWTTKVSYMQHLTTLSSALVKLPFLLLYLGCPTCKRNMLDNQGKLYAASHHTKQCPNQTTVPLTCWTTKVSYMQHLTTLSSALIKLPFLVYMLDNQGKLYAASPHTKQCPSQTTVPPTCWTTKVNYMQHLPTLCSALI